MPSLLEKIILLATRTTVGTIACVLVGTLFIYFVLFGKSKKTVNVKNSTSREIKKDVHDVNRQTKTTTTNDEKHTESKKTLKEEKMMVDKKSDASVKDAVKASPFLAQYEATLAIVLRDAANYKPTPIEIKSMNADVKERGIISEDVGKSREIKVKEVAAIAGIASVTVASAAAASVAVLDNDKDNAPVSKAPEPVLAAFEATAAFTEFKASQTIKSIVSAPEYSQAMTESLEKIANSIVASNPVLAAFEATTASTEFEASQTIKSIVSAPEYKHAMTESLDNIVAIAAKNTVPSNPVLAAFEATTAATEFEASQSIKAIISTPEYSQAMTESLENIATIAIKNIVPSNPVLAAFEATTASVEFEASQSIKSIVSTPEYSQAMTESLENIVSIAVKNIVPSNPVLAEFEATTASVEFEASQTIKSIVSAPEYKHAMTESLDNIVAIAAKNTAPSNPVLAAFEATTAATEFEASQSIKAIISTPEYSQAMTESLENIATIAIKNIVPSNPVLAAFEATTASVEFEASQSIKSIVSASDYKHAMTESLGNIAAIAAGNMVASNPVLAAFEATTASVEFEASQSIKSIVSASDYKHAMTESLGNIAAIAAENMVASNPVLAAFEAITAHCTEAAQKYVATFIHSKDYSESIKAYQEKQIANYPEALQMALEMEPTSLSNSSSNDNLSQYELTTASTISASRIYINNLTSYDEYLNALKIATSKLQNVVTKEVLPTLTTNLASLEATTAYQLLQHQQHNTQQHVESDSDIEVEIEDNVLSSPSAISSVSSTTSSENGTSRGIENEPLQINTLDNKSQFDVSWDQMYSNNNTKSTVVESPKSASPFMSTVDCTYYPNCTNKNCKFVHPGQENNPKPKRAATMDAVYKKPWTKAERIERQSQTHFPTWKSRCVHWPYCTNNHCKYSHPIKECRMGDQCTFMERCMFLHPSDFMEPVNKRHTPKKAQTLPQPQTEIQPESLTQV